MRRIPWFVAPVCAAALVVGLNVNTAGAAASARVPSGAPASPSSGTTPKLVRPDVARMPAQSAAGSKPSRVRELTSRRTASSTSYLMSDGSTQVVASVVPVHYRGAEGGWKQIDPELVRGSGAAPFVNRKNLFDTEVGATTGDLATVRADGRSISMGVQGEARPIVPSAEGSRATFADVFGAADLRYTVEPGVLKEDVVVPDAAAAASVDEFAFTLAVKGFQVRALGGGAIGFFKGGADAPAFVMPAPFMTDAEGERSDEVFQELSGSGDDLVVTVRPDREWLTARGRAFPVLVDPTITIVQPQDGTSDARIYEGATTTAYPWDSQIPVGQNSTGLAHRGLFRFDLSAIPSGTTVKAARLNLHMSSPHTSDANVVPLTAHQLTKDWTATTATWSSLSTSYNTGTGYNQFLLDDTDVDNVSAGQWKDTANSNAIGGTHAKLSSGTTADTFQWNARVPWRANYRVDARIVPAAGQGSPTYIATGEVAASTSVALDQTTGTATGVWKIIASNVQAAPGKTTRVKMTRQGGLTATAPVADAVRWLEFATATKKAYERDAWHSYGVGTIVQNWVNTPSTNFGFMVKATDEAGPVGGVYYQASADVFGEESNNRPELVVIYDEPGPALNPPGLVNASGPELTWAGYNDPTSAEDDNLVEYQIWRGCVTLPGGACTNPAAEHFSTTPSAGLELVGTVDNEVTAFTDTGASSSTLTHPAVYRYWVVARTVADTQNGQPGRSASNEQTVTIPREGRIVRVFTGDISDTTLSAAKPTTNYPAPDATSGSNYRNWLQAGNSHATLGDERAALYFDTKGIKQAVKVTEARLELWESTGSGAGATFDLHALTRSYVETQATWNQATSTTPWAKPGGDVDPTALASLTTDNNPKRLTFDSAGLKAKVQAWVNNTGENHGLLVKARDEAATQQYISILNSEATDTRFRPRLVVEHLVKNDTEMLESPQLPERFVPGTITVVPVVVTNTTDATWPSDLKLSYRWTEPTSSTDLTTEGSRLYAPLGRALEPGESVKVDLQVRTPINSDTGTKRLSYDLYLDLWDSMAGAWWSASHPLASSTARPTQGCAMVKTGLLCVDRYVEDPTSNPLGLEKFASYAGEETGGGAQALTNLASGNLVWSLDAMSGTSIGPSAFVRLAYNSMDRSDDGVGFGVSLQPGTLNRYGSRLSVPRGGSVSNLMSFIDGDGTTHTYKLKSESDTELVYDRPAGVALKLTRDLTADAAHQWVFTRPDGTRFFFNQDTGLQTSTVDRNGNELTYHYDTENRGFLTSVTDSKGRAVLKLGYDEVGVTWIQDISCRALKFTYTSTHQLARISDGGRFNPTDGTFGGNAGGGASWCAAPATAASTKTYELTYNTASTSNNAQLVAVKDPRGATSQIAYWDTTVPDSTFVLWVKSFTDRRGKVTSYQYADGNPANATFCQDLLDTSSKQTCANVTDENGSTPSVTTYRMDGFGRTISIKDANVNAAGGDETTKLGWDRDHNVIRMEEPNGAVSTWEFDPVTGYPLVVKNAMDVKNGEPGIRLAYTPPTGPGRPWLLTRKTSGADRQVDFTYDTVGNLLTVRNELGNGPTYTYNADGTLATASDANGGVTTMGSYDPSGSPLSTTDAMGAKTTVQYDTIGNVIKVTDALGSVTTAEYDDFKRPLATTTPGSDTGPRTTRTTYDANDNVKSQTAPNGAVTQLVYDDADQVTERHIPDNNTTGRTLTYAYDDFGRLLEETAPAGAATTNPDDFVTRYRYDRVGQVLGVDVPFVDTDGSKKTASTRYEYDVVGNQVLAIDPNKVATSATDYSARTVYDLNHRPTAAIDAAGYTTKTEYDADGLVTAQIDALGNRRRQVYDAVGQMIEVHVPHTPHGSTTPRDQVTKYTYDKVGNVTRTTRPTGYYTETVYDLNNRPVQTKSPFKSGDANYATPASTFVDYDPLGRPKRRSLPTSSPTKPTATNQWTVFDYFASGEVKASTDPWSLVTTYAYNENGQQVSRTHKSTADDAARKQTWAFNPDGSLKAKSDTGAQQTLQVIDNGAAHDTATTGTWSTVTGGTNTVGSNYRTHAAAAAGTAAANDTFTWKFTPDLGGSFGVYASCPVRTDSTTAAVFTVNHSTGATNTSVNQKACTSSTQWIKLGSYSFGGGTTKTVTLKPATAGVVVADAVKFVATDPVQTKSYTYAYDANGLLTQVDDGTTGVTIDTYKTSYDGLGRASKVRELLGTTEKRTTDYTYDLNSNITSSHAVRAGSTENAAASRYTSYSWDVRNLVDRVQTGASPTTATSIFEYTYDARGMRSSLTKPNGNTGKWTYYQDGLVHTSLETTSKDKGLKTVASHTLDYNPDGDRTLDISKLDQAASTGTVDQTATYEYTPSRQLAKVTKTGADAGENEAYVYDPAGNIKSQTIGATTTTMAYDRNRLTSTNSGGVTMAHRYDPFGRNTTVTYGSVIMERRAYDGYDREVRHQKYNSTGALEVNKTNTYDPFDRTATQVTAIPGKPAVSQRFTYLGLSDQIALEEQKDTAGVYKVSKTYAYGPGGEKLQLVDSPVSGTTPKTHYYGTNPHGDIETLTDATTGETTSTYRYTAYGSPDAKGTTGSDALSSATGADKIAADTDVVNPYRFNSKRFHGGTGGYDMGFRDYNPGIGRFLSRDLYNGALSDMALGADPWNTNRYAFAGGNPISGIELDGHWGWDWITDLISGMTTGGSTGGSSPEPSPYKPHVSVDDAGEEHVALIRNEKYNKDWKEGKPEIIGTVCKKNVNYEYYGISNYTGPVCATAGPSELAGALDAVQASRQIDGKAKAALLLATAAVAYNEDSTSASLLNELDPGEKSRLGRMAKNLESVRGLLDKLGMAVDVYNNVMNPDLSTGDKAFNITGTLGTALAAGKAGKYLFCAGPQVAGCAVGTTVLSAGAGLGFDHLLGREPETYEYQPPTGVCRPQISVTSGGAPWDASTYFPYCGG